MTNLVYSELAARDLARRHYRHYLPYVQGPAWVETKMSRYIADRVEEFLMQPTGHAYDILVIETPPQHGKSCTVTESLPSWYLGRYPDRQVIIASYDSDYAEKFCRRNKEKIKAEGRKLFGISIGDVDRAAEFVLAGHKGRFISRGIMSGITGNPANLIIIDDPVKNQQEADSPTYRSRVWEEWQSSFKSRLCAGGKVIVIMTPWHEDDFASRLLASEKNSVLLRLPIEAEENDPLGREPGEALCPEIGKDEMWLRDFKESYIHDPAGGQRAWTALYQCSPRREDGNIVSRDWWKIYKPSEAPEFTGELISVDAAFKDGIDNDYVSIQVWAQSDQEPGDRCRVPGVGSQVPGAGCQKAGARNLLPGTCNQEPVTCNQKPVTCNQKPGTYYYLRYCLNKHLNFPDTLEALRTVAKLYPNAKRVLIEDKANGPAIMQMLRKEMFCIPVDPQGGKISRLNAVSAAIESGHVYLPDSRECPWVTDFVDQFTAFPNGAHDDMVDAATQALMRMIYEPGRIEYEKKEAKGLWKFLSKQGLF